MNNTTPVTYVGPKMQILPSELARYENGSWAAERKHDGHWCELKTDARGHVKSLTSRSGSPMKADFQTTASPNSTFIGELSYGTEAAVREGKVVLYVFDVAQLLGNDVTQMSYDQRRELLECITFDDKCKLVEQRTADFQAFFSEINAAGGEGLVLKKRRKKFLRGKTDEWVRVKLFRYVDYIVMSVGKSDGGQPNLQIGLYDGNKLERVATVKNLPKGFKFENVVGRVVEVKGLEVHASGALRHGHFERFRDDKPTQDCTLSAALAIGGYKDC